MGIYVYRVTAKQVTCPDGQKANVFKFAYKPVSGWDDMKFNRKMHFKSGATASDRLADSGKLTSRIVYADDSGTLYWDSCYENVDRVGTFYDYLSGTAKLPRIKFN